MAFVPPAPPLPGDALLEIFVYPSPLRELDHDNKFSDSARLQCLGQASAKLAYYDVLRTRWPNSSAEQLQIMFSHGFEPLTERTAAAYRWNLQVRGYPPDSDFDKHSPQEAHRLFCVYAGAVHVEHGYDTLKQWIADLSAMP